MEKLVGIVGAGTMGSGIAIASIRAGVRTLLWDTNAEQLEVGRQQVAAFLDSSVKRGKLSPDERIDVLDHLELASAFEELHRCSAVIEAVFESLDVKKALLARLDGVCGDDTLFVTNTSTLSVTGIASGSIVPERVVGMHFCNPASLMPLVEVVSGLRTSTEATDRATALAVQMGKTPVTVQDVPGFIVNRFLVPFENDCIRMLEAQVASAREIDTAMKRGLGHPMGPFELLDTVGLDIHRAVSLSLYDQLRN